MPHFQVGGYYVVLLRWSEDRFRLIQEAMSVFEIESLTSGQVSPWDPVRFSKHHGFVPSGAKSAVSDAQLHEVVDGLAALEAVVKGTATVP